VDDLRTWLHEQLMHVNWRVCGNYCPTTRWPFWHVEGEEKMTHTVNTIMCEFIHDFCWRHSVTGLMKGKCVGVSVLELLQINDTHVTDIWRQTRFPKSRDVIQFLN